MTDMDVMICSCGPAQYLGAHKAGSPECCHHCGYMTQAQYDAIIATKNLGARGDHTVDVRIVEDGAGRPAVLLQLPSGFVTMHDPAPVRQLAGLLIGCSDELEQIIEGLTS